MAKIPNLIVRICCTCGKSNHSLKEIKKGKPSGTAWIVRQQERRGKRGNLGKFSKPPSKKIKTSKKPHLLITCLICNKSRNICRPRATRTEVIKR